MFRQPKTEDFLTPTERQISKLPLTAVEYFAKEILEKRCKLSSKMRRLIMKKYEREIVNPSTVDRDARKFGAGDL